MGFRMARTIAHARELSRGEARGVLSVTARGVLLLAALLGLSLQAPAALAETVPIPAPPAVTVPALDAACMAPNDDISTEVPLPRIAEIIQRKAPLKVLAIGSSSTVGLGATSPRTSYPAQLEAILAKSLQGINLDVVSRGVSGELAAATAARMKVEIALTQPDLVLWQVGTNDALAHVPLDELRETLTSTIKWLKANKVDVILVGLQYTRKVARDDHYKAVREVIAKAAEAEGVLLVRRYDAMQFIANAKQHAELLSSDDFHLNDLGYRCMAEHVARAIIVNLFVRPKDARKSFGE